MKKIPISTLKSDVVMLWALVTTSLCIGLLLNQFRDRPLPLAYQSKQDRMMNVVNNLASAKPVVPSTSEAIPEYVGLDEFRAIVEGKKGVVLDARPEIFHRLGHIPGAVSLPREDFEHAYSQHQDLLSDKSALVAVYCSSSSCEDSELVRDALRKLGYTHATVFKGGWSEWTAAGLPEGKNL